MKHVVKEHGTSLGLLVYMDEVTAGNPTQTNSKKPEVTPIATLTRKLQEHLQQYYNESREEISKQLKVQQKLQGGGEEIARQVEHLNLLKAAAAEQILHVGEKMKELEVYSDEAGKDEEVDPDTLITPADNLSRQMLKLSAEVAAIEDCMYYLDRALSNDTIELDDHLKQIRKLARSQFLAKAHIKKIGELQIGATFHLR